MQSSCEQRMQRSTAKKGSAGRTSGGACEVACPGWPAASPKRLRYVAYYRVSTGAQGRSGLGIEAQRETAKRFLAAEGGGWPPLASFTETESGRRSNRPQLAKALAACRAHRATLVVAKVDRLTRSQAFLETLRDSGVEVRLCDLPDVKGATGRFLLAQMAAVAELEAGLISERTKAALAAKVARDGQWDRNASHHLVPGVGQEAAAEAVRDQVNKRARDLADVVNQLRGLRSNVASRHRRGTQRERCGDPERRTLGTVDREEPVGPDRGWR